MMPLLTLSWLVPLAGAVLLLFIGNADGRRDGIIRWLSLVLELAVWVTVIRTAVAFHRSRRGELV